ncbi:hypothetical protein, partial [Clostridium perfringens]|uniref:hypothetical protein n=1 Tax=Clostridium perfringens TaxID=1502 RepID=UPI0032DBB0C3
MRNKWKEVKSRDFEVENKFCKYCGQELPTHDIEQLEEIFNLNKSKELETICTNADKAKKEKEELEEKIEKIKE